MTIRRYDIIVIESGGERTARMSESLTGDVVRWTDHHAAMTALELKYRKRLWLSHGHQGLYGDDGEMQCSECIMYGVMDYKRDPLDKVEEAHHNACMLRVARIIIERSQEEKEE